jgi:hypothetical protein
MNAKPSKARAALVTGAIVVGASLGAAGIASAATSSSNNSSSGSTSTTTPSSGSTSPSSGSATAPPAGDPATMTHGPNETLLTGTDLEKATAAATAAVPGATVIRAETDSSGVAPYEVHMKKSDGTDVTVELNSSFEETSIESGFGPGPAGTAPNGSAPGNSSSSSSTSTN